MGVITTVISFLVKTKVGFILTPCLMGRLNSRACKFVKLTGGFIRCTAVMASTLGSVSNEFVSVRCGGKGVSGTSECFDSILITGLVVTNILLLISSVVAFGVRFVLGIPRGLISDMGVLFTLAFTAFVVDIVATVFAATTFMGGGLCVGSLHSVTSGALGLLLMMVLFSFFPTGMCFLTVTSLTDKVFLLLAGVGIGGGVLPRMGVGFGLFDFGLMGILISTKV